MRVFLDIIYYALPILTTLFIAWKISPKFNNDLRNGRVNPFYLLIVVAIGGVAFIINAFIWATAAFFALRG